MSAYNPQLPLGMEETQTLTFVAPSALNVPVIGVDSATGESMFTLATVNSLIRAVENLALGAAAQYEYQITRNGYKIRGLNSAFIKAELPGPLWPPLPLNLSAGTYQIKMLQKVGTLGARTLTLVWQKSLG